MPKRYFNVAGPCVPGNPVYAEFIIRILNWNVQRSIETAHKDYTVPRYLKDGKIDMDFFGNYPFKSTPEVIHIQF